MRAFALRLLDRARVRQRRERDFCGPVDRRLRARTRMCVCDDAASSDMAADVLQ